MFVLELNGFGQVESFAIFNMPDDEHGHRMRIEGGARLGGGFLWILTFCLRSENRNRMGKGGGFCT